ncbi:MAG: hypothetical protein ACI8W0_000275 [Flavobacterium sp.]|jgi:hypothetical protein
MFLILSWSEKEWKFSKALNLLLILKFCARNAYILKRSVIFEKVS